MSPQRIRRTLLWLLPLFAVRGLVPAGLMLDVTKTGELTMVVCSGVYPLAAASNDHGKHTRHHHNDSDSRQDKQRHSDSICPFAVAASAAVPPSITAGAVALDSIHAVPSVADLQFHSLFGPSRAQKSRAPPRSS